MAILILLALFVLVSALLRRTARSGVEFASPSSLVTAHFASFLAGIRSEVSKLMNSLFLGSPEYVSVLTFPYHGGVLLSNLSINRCDTMPSSSVSEQGCCLTIMRIFQCLMKSLFLGSPNYVFDPRVNRSILHSFQANGRHLTLLPDNGGTSIRVENAELTSFQNTEIVTNTMSEQVEGNMEIDMDLDDPSDEIVHVYQDDTQVIDMEIEDLNEIVEIGHSNNGNNSDMEIDDDLDEEANLLNNGLMNTQVEVGKVATQKRIGEKTTPMMKTKAIEKEKERKARENVMMKEKKIIDARKRRDAQIKEMMKKTRANKYLTDQELRSSKTHAFGFSKGFKAKFELIQEIASGTFGTVYKAQCKNNIICSAKPFMAVKIIERSKLQKPEDIEGIKIEVKLMKTLSGKKNMVTFYGAYEDSEKVYLVMEFCEGGNLGDFYNSRHGENQTRLVIKQILSAMKICHGNNILHRDLKLQNFVLAKKGDLTSLKLIDFGIADFLLPGESLGGVGGSRGFIAPEVYDGRVGYESDCWSVGVIAYLLLAKKMPFPAPTNQSDVLAWRPDLSKGPDYNADTWRCAPSGAMQFVKGLLEPDPARRFTVREALRHEYLQ